jgi:hypothetical protein
LFSEYEIRRLNSLERTPVPGRSHFLDGQRKAQSISNAKGIARVSERGLAFTSAQKFQSMHLANCLAKASRGFASSRML